MLFSVAALLVQGSQGDLGASLRRQAPVSEMEAPQATGPLVIRLERVDALPSPSKHTKDSFYVGNISVGHPQQTMRVLFDTASGHVLLPHRVCKSPACVAHKRYSPWESTTSADVNEDGQAVQAGHRLAKGPAKRTEVTVEFTQADLGSGEAKGVLVRDDVCLHSSESNAQACTDLAILAALKLADQPFLAMPHDGILGLALQGLSAGALSTFYERLMAGSRRLLPHFGLTLGPNGGEIAFGGHDRERLSGPLSWFPVAKPEQGFWQVEIKKVKVGGVVVDECSEGCFGIVDSGSSSLGMLPQALQRTLPNLHVTSEEFVGCVGPVIELDLGAFDLEVPAKDYTGQSCQPEIGSLDLDPKAFNGVYALGTAVLRNYYTAFDWAKARVGFAPLTLDQARKIRKTKGEQVFVV